MDKFIATLINPVTRELLDVWANLRTVYLTYPYSVDDDEEDEGEVEVLVRVKLLPAIDGVSSRSGSYRVISFEEGDRKQYLDSGLALVVCLGAAIYVAGDTKDSGICMTDGTDIAAMLEEEGATMLDLKVEATREERLDDDVVASIAGIEEYEYVSHNNIEVEYVTVEEQEAPTIGQDEIIAKSEMILKLGELEYEDQARVGDIPVEALAALDLRNCTDLALLDEILVKVRDQLPPEYLFDLVGRIPRGLFQKTNMYSSVYPMKQTSFTFTPNARVKKNLDRMWAAVYGGTNE